MNIKITYNWLLEYLETDADPYEIQKYLSLSGPSIESVEKIGDDYIFDIEIITNRIDYASVYGVAQEALAILPLYGKKAILKNNPLTTYSFKNFKSDHDRNQSLSNLKVKIQNPILCSRFSAVVLDKVKILPSPGFIKNRLTNCGIKSINNVVDISNYLMLSLGQPVHIFDYDQIEKQTMLMRSSAKEERIVTLDKKEISLPGDDIVIEDGAGRLVDLCGIMGGLNSAVTNKTKRIILFVQTYNKEKIRKTVMNTGVRTVAATYFEKGLDEERVEPTLIYGVELLTKYASAKLNSKIIDIYPKPYIKKSIVLDYGFINKKIGIDIDNNQVNNILNSLGFTFNNLEDDRTKIVVNVPSWRQYDTTIKEDLIEEIARIYGYHNIPDKLPPPALLKQPEAYEKLFSIISRIKYFLKHIGLSELINYSMVSKELILKFDLKPENHLKILNPISEEIEYMRTTLLPSLYKNINDNTGKRDTLKLFEITKVYQPNKNDLPKEIYKLGIVVNTDYLDLKGIAEALYQELNIDKLFFEQIIEKDNVFFIEIDLQQLIDHAQILPVYKPINPFAVIKLDKTFTLNESTTYEVIKRLGYQSKLLQKMEVLDLFKNKLTIRFYYNSSQRNITEEEAKKELQKYTLSL